MSGSEWKKVDFQQFVNNFGNEIVIKNTPEILYSKKDKEHEAYNSLISFKNHTLSIINYISQS